MGRGSAPPMIDVSPLHRYPLIIINLVVMVFSGIIAGGCVYSLYERWDDFRFLKSSVILNVFVNLEIPLLVISAFGFVLGDLGFIGALRENIGLLRGFEWCIWFLEYVDIIIALLAVMGPLTGRNYIQGVITIDFIEHYRENPDFKGLVDYIQSTFECCGVTIVSYRDWNHNMYFNCSNTNPSVDRCAVPSSCCRPDKDDSQETPISRRHCGQNVLQLREQEAWEVVYTKGCPSAIMSKVRGYCIYITIGCGVVLVIMLVIRTMAETVRSEIYQLTKFYEKYYRAIRRGVRKRIAKERALRQIPKGCVVVETNERDTSDDEPPPPGMPAEQTMAVGRPRFPAQRPRMIFVQPRYYHMRSPRRRY